MYYICVVDGSDSNPQMRPLDESDSNSRNGQE